VNALVRPWISRAVLFVGSGLLAGCGLLFSASSTREPPLPAESGSPEAHTSLEVLIPPRLGRLRQDQISIEVRRGGLRLQLTPLDEAYIRTTTPEIWERLSALRRAHQGWFRERTGSDAVWTLVLVTASVESEPHAVEAEGLTLISRGIRHRAVEIRGVGTAWETGIVHPREPLLAVYAFPPEARFEPDLEVEYLEIRTRDWPRVFSEIEAEWTRIRGGAGGYSISKR